MANFPMNPYQRWLGYPGSAGTPTFYQLLGVARTEQNADEIFTAGRRLEERVRALGPQDDPHGFAYLLDEIHAAIVVLTTPERRNHYDQTLSQGGASHGVAPSYSQGGYSTYAQGGPSAGSSPTAVPMANSPGVPYATAYPAAATPYAPYGATPAHSPHVPYGTYPGTSGQLPTAQAAYPMTGHHPGAYSAPAGYGTVATYPAPAPLPPGAPDPMVPVGTRQGNGAPTPSRGGAPATESRAVGGGSSEGRRVRERMRNQRSSWTTMLASALVLGAVIVVATLAINPPSGGDGNTQEISQVDQTPAGKQAGPSGRVAQSGTNASADSTPADAGAERPGVRRPSGPATTRDPVTGEPIPDRPGPDSVMIESDPAPLVPDDRDMPDMTEGATNPAMPDPANPNPAAPTPEPPPQPAPPATTPAPMPTPPPGPMPTAEERAQLSKLLTEARAAIGRQQYSDAESLLAEADPFARLPEHRAALERLRDGMGLAKQFRESIDEALASIQPGEDIQVTESTFVSFVEIKPDRVVVRVAGANRRYARNELPLGLARVLAERRLAPDDPSNKAIKAVFVALATAATPDNLEQARTWLQEAIAAGVPVKHLLPLIDEKYVF